MALFRVLALAFFLGGCASSPYVDARFGYQHDGGSDWVLQPEREWTPSESEVKLWLQTGLEWDKQLSCPYVDVLVSGPWDQAFVGCSMRFGKKFYVEPSINHQIDSMSSEFIRTDQRQWQGHNPFAHLRVGYQINPAFRVALATGMSTHCLSKGKGLKEVSCPDLYWTDVEAGVRFFGKRGLFSKDHLER